MLDRNDLMTVVRIGTLLTSERDPSALLRKITALSCDAARCDGGTLYLYKNGKLEFAVMKTLSLNIDRCGDIDLPPVPLTEDNVCAYAALHGETVNIPNVYESERFNFTGPRKYDALTGYRTRSMLVVPLLGLKNELIGVLQLLNATDGAGHVVPFSEDMETVIRSVGSQAAVAIINNILAAEAARTEQEMEVSRTIQSSALPGDFDLPGFSLFASMDTAREVGGDFYDFFPLEGGRCAFLIADVSGKGITAALFMMKAHTLIRYAAKRGGDPASVLTEVNNALCEGNPLSMFVTCWMGIADPAARKLIYTNAGHPFPLLRRKDGLFEPLKSRVSLPLGGMEGIRYRLHETGFDPGDALFLYTDGVTEAQDGDNALYGDARLLAAANTLTEAAPEAFCRDLRKDLDAFVGAAPQFDDITMLYLRSEDEP